MLISLQQLLFYALCILWQLTSVEAALQTDSMNFTSMTRQQVSQLQDCFFLKAEQLVQIPADAYDGFKTACISSLSSSALSLITADQFSRLSVTSMSALQGFTCRRIPAPAFSKLNSQQVGAFAPSEMCNRLLSDQFQAIPISSLSGMKPECVKELSATVMGNFDADRISALSDEATSGFTSSVANIPASSFAVLRQEQLAAFNAANIFGACSALRPDQIAEIRASVWSGMTKACVSMLRIKSIQSIKGEQIVNLPLKSVSGFDVFHTSKFSIESVCPVLNGTFLKSLEPRGISGLSAKCITKMSADALQFLNQQQISIMGSATAGIRAEQWDRLSPQQVGWFSAQGLSSLSEEACSRISRDQFDRIRDLFMDAFDYKCTARFQTELALLIDSLRMKYLSAEALYGFRPDFVRKIQPSAFAVLKLNQTKGLSAQTCFYLRPVQFRAIPPASLANATDCISNLHPTLVDLVTEDHVKNFNSSWLGVHTMMYLSLQERLGENFVKYVQPNKMEGGEKYESFYNSWSRAQCYREAIEKGMLQRQSGSFDPNWFTLIFRSPSVSTQLSQARNETLLAGLRNVDPLLLTKDQWRYVTPLDFQDLQAETLNQLDKEILRSLRWEQLSSLSPDVIPKLEPQLFLDFSADVAVHMTCAQVLQVTSEQEMSLTVDALIYFQQKRTWCDQNADSNGLVQSSDSSIFGVQYNAGCMLNYSDWYSAKKTRLSEDKQLDYNYTEPACSKHCYLRRIKYYMTLLK